ncbi:MAG: YHS domain-containing (seleno)protein [Thermodesulfobacteriota bacterium]
MKVLCAFLLIMAAATNAATLSPEARQDQFNITSSGPAIQGYDPVAYFSGRAIRGDQAFSFTFQGIEYIFSSAENLAQFKKNPQRFEPAYGGWCAWAMLEGEKVEINPKRFKIIDDRLYLFYDRFFNNTLKKWHKLAVEKGDSALVEKADKQWQAILSK